MNSETRNCQNCKNDFIIDGEDFDFYSKMKVPPPTFCPECRLKRRLASLNQRSLFYRACSKCAKLVPSMYHPDSPFIVYCSDCYFSDKWDAREYAAEYDFSKPFFEQFNDLIKKVPQLNLEHSNNNGENIFFSNYIYRSRNVYLSSGIVRSENIYYSWAAQNDNKMCFDCTVFSGNENCYELVNSKNNYNCIFLTRSYQCLDSRFLFDCANCSNCFMSSNLRNCSYVFRNKQLTKEVYKEKMKEYEQGSFLKQEESEQEYIVLMEKAIHRYSQIFSSENCSGNFIKSSKNAMRCFSIQDCLDIKYGQMTSNAVSNSYDFSMSGRADNSYEFAEVGRGNDYLLFTYNVGASRNTLYCDGCEAIENCFGCTGLKHKSYCILNRQYTKEEYEELVPKIIAHMNAMPYVDQGGRVYAYGEYFPINFSRFPYNESAAFEFFPISKEEVVENKYIWRDAVKKGHTATKEWNDIPDTIDSIPSEYTNEIFECEHKSECNHICTNAFRMVKEELEFYKKHGIALPRLCPNCRYFTRMNRMLPWKLWNRKCMNKNCSNEFETSYAPDRREKVYCEKCYQQEVV